MTDGSEERDRGLAARTLELCRIASVTGDEGALADEIAAQAARLALPCRRYGNGLVVGDADAAEVGFFGHLDTVPPHPADAPPRLEGGRVFGRGASDMKGGLAVMEALAARPAAPGAARAVYVFYDREEGPYRDNGLEPLLEACPGLLSLRFGVCLEPTGNRIEAGCCGSLHATVVFEGRSAHSARPWQGENAIHKAGALLAELAGAAPVAVDHAGLRFFDALSATQAHGGRARNVVPDAFALNLNYRFAPGRTLDEAKAQVLALVAGRARVEFVDEAPAGPVATGPWLERLRTRTGAAVEAKQAWTDVARLAARGVPAVNLGPGDPEQAHQAGESASVERLGLAYRALERFLAPE